ncbi:MAG TPA: HAD family hydrolase [Candidatus Aenigmarchaeota archaeon]|nr:HAD family hydrolase [Candidatus Aenigmarchaeota archaeon]
MVPEVKGVLSDLKGNYILGILSNTDNETLFSAVKHTELEKDYILASEKARKYKPNANIFLRACSDLGLNKDEVVYVGNSLTDIVRAKKAGLMMIQVNRQRSPLNSSLYLPDYEVESLLPISRIIRCFK